MSSLLTNTSAMTALQSLSSTQKDLTKTQAQISSGLAVANASDNAAYWSIATSMKSDVSALGAVTNALNLGASVLNSATSAMTGVENILKQMKADLVTAQTAGANKVQVQSDITAQQQSLKSIISSASFNGVNLLDGTTTKTNIVDSFSRSNSGDNLGLLSIDTSAAGLLLADAGTGGTAYSAANGSTAAVAGTPASAPTTFTGVLSASLGMAAKTGAAGNTTTFTDPAGGSTESGFYAQDSVLGFDLSNASSADLTVLANGIDNAIASVTTAASTLGQYSTVVSNQLTYTSSLSDAITSGVGSLVDADMNVASTRLQALQTQQQLGIQALSMANQNSQLILKLFQ